MELFLLSSLIAFLSACRQFINDCGLEPSTLFYSLGVFVVWLVLAWLIWKAWRYGSRVVKKPNQPILNFVFGVAAISWLAIFLWQGGGRDFYYDMEVERLCAIDGGAEIYEEINLKQESIGEIASVPLEHHVKSTDNYYYIEDEQYIKNNPAVVRVHYGVVRSSDNKILGSMVAYSRNYYRSGFYGLWRPYGFYCPSVDKFYRTSYSYQSDLRDELLKKIFVIN